MKMTCAVEIGEHYFKILTSSRSGTQVKLSDFFVLPVNSLSDEEIAAAISDIFKKNRYRFESVAVSMPRNFVTVRNLHLPSNDESEISKMIELHISRVVPYKKEEVFFSYQPFGRDEMGYAKILLAIVNKDIMRRAIKIVESTGVFVDKVLLSSNGVWQWLLKNYGDIINSSDLYLCLDIDTTFTDFIVFNRENLLFSRSISLKARDFDAELGRKKLLGEVRQSLLIFNNEEQSEKPVMIFLSGAGSSSLGSVIEAELGIKVQTADAPFFERNIKKKENKVPSDVSLTAAVSLLDVAEDADFSFVLPEIQVRKSLRKKMKELVFLGLFLVYFLSLVFFVFLGRLHHKQIYMGSLSGRADRIEQEFGQVAGDMDKIEYVKSILHTRKRPLFIMDQLQKVIPVTVSIISINVDEENQIVFHGQAFQLSDVFDLATNLEKITLFKDVQTRNTRKKQGKNREIVEFEMRFLLQD